MTLQNLKTSAREYWISTRDTVLTIAGVAAIFFSFPLTDKFGWVAGGALSGLGICALSAVWDGIAERARAKAMIETINLMAKDGGFNAELTVTYRDEKSTIQLKTEDRS